MDQNRTLDDAVLLQRVVSRVLQSAARGDLPRLSWRQGLTASECSALRTRWPEACMRWDEQEQRPLITSFAGAIDLLEPLRALLFKQRADAAPELVVLANVLACACFGSHHLWHDLGASGRSEVTRLMVIGFPALHDSNVHDLRWKRHLFICLGDELGLVGLRPPKCSDCGDYDVCFGSTDKTVEPVHIHRISPP